jgi:putative tryptophan/tyrosine transport system substrate-binding protein
LTPAVATPKFGHEIGVQAMRAAQIPGPSMKRRDAIKLLGAAAAGQAWPAMTFGQTRKVAKVGFLYPGLSSVAGSRLQAFRDGLREAGWGDGQVEIITRFAESVVSRNAGLVQELIAAKVDVLIPISFISVEAARAATKTIPIVAFDLETDPIAGGIAANLARPGGNVTGVYFDFPDFSSKWMELLKEAIPRLSKVVVVRDPSSPSPQLKGVETAARTLGVKLDSIIDVVSPDGLDAAFRSASERGPDAVLILSSPLFGTNPGRVANLTITYRLPTITLFPEIARAGGLMAYGVDLDGAFRQAGGMAGKVLSGTNPAELPIERPTRFEFVVNAKTAKSLGIELPTSVLLRANEVIE